MGSIIAKFIQGVGTLTIGIAFLIGLSLANGYVSNGLTGRTIVVTGKSRQFVQKDQSILSGAWQAEGKTSDGARESVRTKAAKALTALKAAGINEKKIDTTDVAVNPVYDYRIDIKPQITNYRATTTLEVTLEDTKRADEIISIMTKNEATSTDGPRTGFSNTKLDQIEKELKQQAVTDARAQAEILAKEAGAKLGDVVTISGDGVSYPYSYRTPGLSAINAAEIQNDNSDITIGEEEITATISVTYQLR